MENLNSLLQDLFVQIKNNNLNGYKNLLFLIYKDLMLDEKLEEETTSFLKSLFENNVVIEHNNQEIDYLLIESMKLGRDTKAFEKRTNIQKDKFEKQKRKINHVF